MAKYIEMSSGVLQEVQPVNSSAGVGDAGKMIQLDAAGRIDNSMMPVGIGADSSTIEASETLAAGDLVNIWNDGGTPKVRKADATNNQPAHGFVLSAYVATNNATVYHEGSITGLSGLTGGDNLYLSGTAGGVTATAPSGAGDIVQRVGVAVGTTEASFEPGTPVTLV
jgi:hypothetical protein